MDDMLADHFKSKKTLLEEIYHLKRIHLKEKRDLNDEILELRNRIRGNSMVIEELQAQNAKIKNHRTNVISENLFLRQKVEELERRPRPLPCGLPEWYVSGMPYLVWTTIARSSGVRMRSCGQKDWTMTSLKLP